MATAAQRRCSTTTVIKVSLGGVNRSTQRTFVDVVPSTALGRRNEWTEPTLGGPPLLGYRTALGVAAVHRGISLC